MNLSETNAGIFPEHGLPKEKVLQQLAEFRGQNIAWEEGRTWSLVYHIDEGHKQLLHEAYGLFASANMLNPFAFQGLRRIEEDIIRMTADMLHGDENTVGTITSGGSESIFLAVYSSRERAAKKGVRKPEMVIPVSLHPAFAKAAHIMNIKVHKVATDDRGIAVPEAMAARVNRNTIMLAASAPSYPHGSVDPIAEIGAIAEQHNIPFHVDGCIGGFMLPWVEALGRDVPLWDYRVPGVTSISADLHKFGYGAKGASALTYRSIDYLKYQFYVDADYPGGVYAVPNFQGTRPGGPIAAAWAALRSLGREGYLRVAGQLMEATDHFRERLESIPEIEIVGVPAMNILAYKTVHNKPDIFVVADQLEDKGWMLDRQQFPNCIHLTIQRHNLPVMDRYLADLQEAIHYGKANPGASAKGQAALYGLMARLPLRGMVKQNVLGMFEEMYGGRPATEGPAEKEPEASLIPDTPRWMGWLNRVLAILGRK